MEVPTDAYIGKNKDWCKIGKESQVSVTMKTELKDLIM
jgi:hypothetical protein